MYTQVRGFLNVDSIGYKDNYYEILNKLDKAKFDFENDDDIEIDRKWVCENTTCCIGANSSVFLFIGTELKNYDNPAMAWLKYLLDYFPNAEGIISFQYEEEEFSTLYFICHGEIVGSEISKFKTFGYGNEYN